MLFKRRKKQSLIQTLRGWVWPRAGFRRAGLYVWHRLARLPGPPENIAAGFATGVAISFTPFLGLHIILGLLICALIRGNAFAMIIGTLIGNPWTFPFFFALDAYLGTFMLGDEVIAVVPVWSWQALFDSPLIYLGEFLPVIFPLVVGSVPVGLTAWMIAYFVFKRFLSQYRASRRPLRRASPKLPGGPSNEAA